MFKHPVDLEIWMYNMCRHCLNKDGCIIKKELVERGIAPEVEGEGLTAKCHSMRRKPLNV